MSNSIIPVIFQSKNTWKVNFTSSNMKCYNKIECKEYPSFSFKIEPQLKKEFNPLLKHKEKMVRNSKLFSSLIASLTLSNKTPSGCFSTTIPLRFSTQ